MKVLFRDVQARRIVLGQLISQVCEKMFSLGLIWWIAEVHSETWLPWWIAIVSLPHLFSVKAAARTLARRGALRVVIDMDLARAILYLAAAVLFSQLSPNGALAMLVVVGIAANFCGAFFSPAILALPIQVARKEDLQPVSALVDACFTMSSVLGPALSVPVYQYGGVPALLALNAVSYGFAAFLSMRIRLRDDVATDAAHETAPPRLRDVVRREPWVLKMFLMFLAMNFAFAPLLVFMPLYARQILVGGIGVLAVLEFSLGLGQISGALGLSFVTQTERRGEKLAVCLFFASLGYLGFVLSRSVPVAVASLVGLGLFLAMSNVFIINILQTRPRVENIPSVLSLTNLISVASFPISMSITGWLLKSVALTSIALGCAGALIALSLVTFAVPEIREA